MKSLRKERERERGKKVYNEFRVVGWRKGGGDKNEGLGRAFNSP